MIDPEDFSLWLDHPVTTHVFKQFGKIADQARQAWLSASWEHGQADPILLADLRARAEVVNDLITVSYEDIDDSSEAKTKE